MRKHYNPREVFLFYLFIAPWLIGFLLFTVGPMMYSFCLSFTKYNITSAPVWIGISNYVYLFKQDASFWKSLSVTLQYTVLFVPLSLLISLLTALLLNQDVAGKSIFRTIFFLPSLLPSAASSILWVWIFNSEYGLLNRLMAIFGTAPIAWTESASWALPALIIMGLWGFGGGMIIILAGLQGVPATLYEAAELEGARRLRKFWHITLPMISPVLFFNLVLGIIGAMKVFDQVYVFGRVGVTTGPGGPARATLFYVLYLYIKGFNYFHMGLASAMAWLLFLLILALTGINWWLGKKWVYYES